MQPNPRLIHCGNNNYINIDRILAVSGTKAISIRRAVKDAEANGLLLDFTAALPTKGIALFDNGVIVKIPLRPMDIARALKVDEIDAI